MGPISFQYHPSLGDMVDLWVHASNCALKFFWCKAFLEGSYYNYNIVFNYYYYYSG